MRKLVVKVPPGVDEGTQIRLQGEGESGTGGGPNGHLYVQIAIKPHEKFKRDNQDLLSDLPLNIAQAALGDEVKIPTLEGDEMLKIPAGTQEGKTFRLKNARVQWLATESTESHQLLLLIRNSMTGTKLSSAFLANLPAKSMAK